VSLRGCRITKRSEDLPNSPMSHDSVIELTSGVNICLSKKRFLVGKFCHP